MHVLGEAREWAGVIGLLPASVLTHLVTKGEPQPDQEMLQNYVLNACGHSFFWRNRLVLPLALSQQTKRSLGVNPKRTTPVMLDGRYQVFLLPVKCYMVILNVSLNIKVYISHG